MRCFRAWETTGARVVSANSPDVAARLRKAGVPETALWVVPEAKTGLALYRSPAPLLLPLLARLEHQGWAGSLLLARPDLYPATRSAAVVDFWTGRAPAAGLAAETCASVESQGFAETRPEADGISAAAFRPGVLARVRERLAAAGPAARLCLGVAGWDLPLAAAIVAEGGMLAGSGLLLHEPHLWRRPVPAAAEAWRPHLVAMGLSAAEAGQPSLWFADMMRRGARSRLLARALYFRPAPQLRPPGAAAQAVAARLAALSPMVGWALLRPAIARLAERDIAAGRPDFLRAVTLFSINPDPEFLFTQRLLAVLYCRLCSQARPGPALTTRYPPSNRHRASVTLITDRCPPDSPHRRMEFAQLFGIELIDYGILNPRLYNYLVQSAERREEQAILAAIRQTFGDHADAAA